MTMIHNYSFVIRQSCVRTNKKQHSGFIHHIKILFLNWHVHVSSENIMITFVKLVDSWKRRWHFHKRWQILFLFRDIFMSVKSSIQFIIVSQSKHIARKQHVHQQFPKTQWSHATGNWKMKLAEPYYQYKSTIQSNMPKHDFFTNRVCWSYVYIWSVTSTLRYHLGWWY